MNTFEQILRFGKLSSIEYFDRLFEALDYCGRRLSTWRLRWGKGALDDLSDRFECNAFLYR